MAEASGGAWDSFLGGLGNTANAALGTYLQSRVSDPAKKQFTVAQSPDGPVLKNSAAPGILGGLSPLAMVAMGAAALAALGIVVWAVKK